MKYIISMTLCMMLFTLISCASQPVKGPPDKVTLQLKWVHQAQFAGYYVANEKGYYAQENIQVEFLEGGQDVEIVQPVLSGQADFGIQSPDDLLVRRSQGQPLTAISAIYRRSAVVFVAMADSGIKRPQDFTGKKIASIATGGASEFQTQLAAMLKILNLNPDLVKIFPYDSNYDSFINREIDVTPAYSTSGLIKLRQKGLILNLIWPSDYRVNFYSDTLYTTDSLIADNPGLVTRFLRASLRGWQDAIEDYRQAVNITLRYAPAADPQLQTAMIEAMLPLVHTGEDRLGWMKSAVWQGMYAVLTEQSVILQPFDVNKAYTMRFLEEVYGSNLR